MHEIPPVPERKTKEEMSDEEKIQALSLEIQELIRRQGEATDPLIKKSIELQLSQKMNERAGYIMRRAV